MDALITIIALLLCTVTALYWGVVLSLRLPEVARFFDRKPFSCRPCLTFHLTWMLIGVFALMRHSWTLAGIGVVVAFVVFFIVRRIDKNKIIE